jgi:hypothetical protein
MVESIESDIRQLSPAEFAELREWLLHEDAEAWDRQIEEDAAAGKLDGLFRQAQADHGATPTKPSRFFSLRASDFP